MPDHLSPIGLAPIAGDGTHEEAVYSLIGALMREVIERHDEVRSPHGLYLHHEIGDGVEWWAQFRLHEKQRRARFVGGHPHFVGPARREVRLLERRQRPDHNKLEGAFYGSSDEACFVFEVPDYDRWHDLELPVDAKVQLAGFAAWVKAFATEEEYEHSNAHWSHRDIQIPGHGTATISRSATSLIADGVTADARITGRVLAHRQCRNAFTEQPFHHLTVETVGGELDIVAAPKDIEGTVAEGGIIDTECWLTGLIEPLE